MRLAARRDAATGSVAVEVVEMSLPILHINVLCAVLELYKTRCLQCICAALGVLCVATASHMDSIHIPPLCGRLAPRRDAAAGCTTGARVIVVEGGGGGASGLVLVDEGKSVQGSLWRVGRCTVR